VKKHPEYKKRWALAAALLRLNPNASYARIARATNYTGQMVGIIAREIGLPPKTAGGFNVRDEVELNYPKEEYLSQLYGEYDKYKGKETSEVVQEVSHGS
jgi:hypothetical protein